MELETEMRPIKIIKIKIEPLEEKNLTLEGGAKMDPKIPEEEEEEEEEGGLSLDPKS